MASRTLVLFLSIALISCDGGFEKSYYEKITNIKFPDKYKLITSADNVEFVTITILDLYKRDCKKFIKDNNFQPVTGFFPTMFGLNLIDKRIATLPDKKVLLVNYCDKRSGKAGWTYFIDTTTCRLYCEVDYPDWGGN